jgi:dihydropyrimidine dehydrogenase (NAD+) subunit PreT
MNKDDCLKSQTISVIKAVEESSRCLLCYDAPCSKACPAGTDPAKFIRSIRFENFYGAAKTVRENNILGGICARICPYEKYCEGACIRAKIDNPVKIGMLQQFAADYSYIPDPAVLELIPKTSEKIAIIGSGPAGLSAAAQLAQQGFAVTVFEKEHEIGGWLTFGIPEDRLPRSVVERELQNIRNLGVEFVTGVAAGSELGIEKLEKSGYAAILLATGLHKSRPLELKGSELKNVMNGTDYLLMGKIGISSLTEGKKVVVVGGGDVAIDCACSAKLSGAQEVIILYRRSIEKMPASKEAKGRLSELCIPIFTGFKPAEIIGWDGAAAAIKGTGMDDCSEVTLETDIVIFALGQDSENIDSFALLEHDGQSILTNHYMTSEQGIFACGDIIGGDKTVVYAVKSGKEAAGRIAEYLSAEKQPVIASEVNV